MERRESRFPGPNPHMAYGAPVGFAPLTDEGGIYLPTGPGDAQRMELLRLQISPRPINKLINQDDIQITVGRFTLVISQNLGDNE